MPGDCTTICEQLKMVYRKESDFEDNVTEEVEQDSLVGKG